MNFYFIVDTSFSMLQVCNHYSLLDIAKMIVEKFTDLRVKSQESKFDKYYLSPTVEKYESNIVPYLLPNDSSIFQIQLRTLQICPKNNISKAIVNAYNVLNEFRLLQNFDNILGGRDAYRSDSSIIILLTDGNDATYVDQLSSFFQSEVNVCRWDQQLLILLLNPFDSKNKYIKTRQAPKYYSKLLEFANQQGGTCSILDSVEMVQKFVEAINLKMKHRLMINLKTIKIENYKSDTTMSKYFGEHVNDNPTETDPNKELVLKSKLVIKFSANQLANRNNMISKIPFPEDPHFVNFTKYFSRQELDMTFKAESLYYRNPTYFIDFNKYLASKLSQDLPYDRFEVEENCELFSFVCNHFKNQNMKKVFLPVYFFNKYSNPSQGKMELFGLLRYVKSELDSQIGIDLMIYPINLHEFNEIWEDSLKENNNIRMRNELPGDLALRLENYFNKVPYYYSYYLFEQFKNVRKLGDALNRRWNFFTKFYTLIQQKSELTFFQNTLKKHITEKKINEKNTNDRKIESLKADMMKNLNLGIIIPKKDEPVESDLTTSKNLSLLDKLFEEREILFSSKPKSTTIIEQKFKKMAISKMSNYHETAAKLASLKNHLEDETDTSLIREPMPFGNPFKYRYKSMSDKEDYEAFMSSFFDNANIENMNSSNNPNQRRPDPRRDSRKQDPKQKGMKRSLSLKGLQLALEESTRSTSVSVIDEEERKEIVDLEIRREPSMELRLLPMKSSVSNMNPIFFIAENADVFRKFSIMLKSPPVPTPELSSEDRIKKDVKEIIEKLNVNDKPELKERVLQKLKDILRVNNFRINGLN